MESTIGATESVSAAVHRAVCAVTGRHPDSTPPLAAVLDPDALDALFEPRSDGAPRRGGHLSFVYSNCRITIDNGEFLTVEPVEPMERRSTGSAQSSHPKRSQSTRETHQTAPSRDPGSRVCFVCQQPIDRENLAEERGELVHPHCRATLRYGISLETWDETSA